MFEYIAVGCSARGIIVFGVFSSMDKALTYVKDQIAKDMPSYRYTEETHAADSEEHILAHHAIRILDPIDEEEIAYVTIMAAVQNVGLL